MEVLLAGRKRPQRSVNLSDNHREQQGAFSISSQEVSFFEQIFPRERGLLWRSLSTPSSSEGESYMTVKMTNGEVDGVSVVELPGLGDPMLVTNQSFMYRQLLLIAVMATVALFWAMPSRAQKCPPNCPFEVLPKTTLEITTSAVNATLLEHSPLEIPYKVTLEPGVGGALPVIDLVVCGADSLEGGTCDVYDQVRPNWTSPAGSKLRLKAPLGGSSVNMRVVACTKKLDSNQVISCKGQLDEKSFVRPISARFIVNLDSFTILSTRAQHTDTVYVGLEAMFGSNNQEELVRELKDGCPDVFLPPTLAKPILCKGPVKAGRGDLGHGTYPLSALNVGEFEVIPGSGGFLTFGFALFNYGFVVHPEILTGSMAGNVQGAIAGQLDNNGVDEDFTWMLNSSPWLGCDGPTAAGAVRLRNFNGPTSLDAVTQGTGGFTQKSKIYVTESQAGCRESSRYSVQWTVRRTSW